MFVQTGKLIYTEFLRSKIAAPLKFASCWAKHLEYAMAKAGL